MNVLFVVATTSNHLPLAGSVGLGYGWFVALLSSRHVNVIPLSAILIFSPVLIPCETLIASAVAETNT